MDRRKRYRQTVALMSMLSETKTIDNVDIATFDGNGENLLSLIVGVDPVQSGSGDPSPENIRPITGWTECNISHSGADTSDPTIYTIAFPSEAGTVYGGTLDVVRKKLTVNKAIVDLGTLTWGYNSVIFPAWPYFYATINDKKNGWNNGTMSSYKLVSSQYDRTGDFVFTCTPYYSAKNVVVSDSRYTDADSFKSAVSGQQYCYDLAAPLVYDLADVPTIQTFAGENNIWADTGKIIFLEYEA